ncbi:glycoside hydrolase family 15 protein [Tilletiaria anomala UBC 951]|uniref:glucan 1,4-alpha-glucosidase n=1 Tax=Tilletiaria anomala (strain ATCC 24038 / CBS 436.72 / UBC 951) TaxID=1037660 RepID=A0A066VUY1_TILAU|nr:glycoside hydrolase family 15 protein [Tilletiaria anomala UBC 951]KDN42624.1 glycoside hydrolase family 15 protein [Tilletiaria anomala UBC 951]
MQLRSSFAALGTSAALTFLAISAPGQVEGTVTDSYSYTSMIANIGGANSNTQVPNVQTGAVIASPSTDAPDYFYAWVRDSAMTMKVVIDNYIKGTNGVTRTMIENWARAEQAHQANAASSSSSLGEPKFNVDGSLFTGPWGRPQNDGPALRATAFMKYARAIGLSDTFTKSTLYQNSLSGNSLIKNDLEYVAHHWQDSNFDPWEEVQATHFFTLSVQRRAMAEGAKFATDMGDSGAATYYAQQAAAIQSKLQSFWSSSQNRVNAYQGVSGRSGIDCSVMLGALHGWNQTSVASSLDNTQFGPATDRILATQKQYVDAFRSLYAINNNTAAPTAVATGRYPEDEYSGNDRNGGNPWFLCTLAAAEVVYNALHVFNQAQALSVTIVSQPFFAQFASGLATGMYAANSATYATLTRGMKAQADGFVQVVQSHAQTNGSMNEEMDRNSGYNVGARDLTWNYASWLTKSQAANGTPAF